MKKVGIITFHEVFNYGGILQNYALQQVIMQLDDSFVVETIDLKRDYFSKKINLINIEKNNFFKSLLKSLYLYRYKSEKKKKFNEFVQKDLFLSNPVSDTRNVSIYDYYIVGSDQVWNPEITHYDRNFFFPFVMNKGKKISYAASIGKEELNNEEYEFIKKNVDNIDCISTREESAQIILKSMGFSNVEVVLDPTLLLKKDHWIKLDNQKFKGKKYVLVYSLEKNELLNKIAKCIARQNNLEIVNMIPENRKDFLDKNNSFGPYEFISAVKNATYVVTNSFHGTAFSIIFEKNFFTIPHKTRGTRMRHLLETLDLNERIIEEQSDLSSTKTIKWPEVNEKLDVLRAHSIDFLSKSLDEKE